MEVQHAALTGFFLFMIHLLGLGLAGAALRSLWRSRRVESLAIPLCYVVALLTVPIVVSMIVLLGIGWDRWSKWVTQWFL